MYIFSFHYIAHRLRVMRPVLLFFTVAYRKLYCAIMIVMIVIITITTAIIIIITNFPCMILAVMSTT